MYYLVLLVFELYISEIELLALIHSLLYSPVVLRRFIHVPVA